MSKKKKMMAENSNFVPEISVVMPCLNEERTLGVCIEKAKRAIDRLGIKAEIVIADNGSTDQSVKIAKSLGARVVHQPLKGYGNAYIKGISEAKGKYIVIADSDNTYDLGELERFILPLKNDYDMVMGSRLKGKIMPGAMPFLHRYIGNPLLSGFLNMLFRTGISDAHCGMRSFTKDAYERMCLQTTGMEFASEMVINASKCKFKIKEIPITLHANTERDPHLRTFRDGWRHLRFMLLYSPEYLFMIPGFLVFIIGISSMIYLALQDVFFYGLKLGPNTMTIGSFATLVGLQVLIFSLIAKVYYSNMNPLFKLKGLTQKIFHAFKLERGIFIGIIFFTIGFIINLKVAFNWYNNDFGELTFFEIKIALVAFTSMMVAVELIFSSFLLSIISKK